MSKLKDKLLTENMIEDIADMEDRDINDLRDAYYGAVENITNVSEILLKYKNKNTLQNEWKLWDAIHKQARKSKLGQEL